MLILYFTVAFAGLLQGLHSAHWTTSVRNGDAFYACQGSRITIPWQFATLQGDTINDIQWYFSGRSEELIAVEASDAFVPLPAFATRLEQIDNAGLILSNVTVGDSGRYSVEVNGFVESGAHFALHRHVIVQVSDQLMTQDGHLHVTQNPEAVLDKTTDQWAILLQCGNFSFFGPPAFPVEWTTPDGRIYSSSDFSEGHFQLLLNKPVQGGKYTCRVPPQHQDDACIRENQWGRDQGEASLVVDGETARLAILEKENQALGVLTGNVTRVQGAEEPTTATVKPQRPT